MKAELSWKRVALNVLATVVIYPLALILVIGTDTSIGEAEFLRQVLWVSKHETIMVIGRDWLSAAPLAVAFWLVARGASRTIGTRIVTWVGILVALVGITLAIVPPYLPMIFGAMMLVTVLINVAFERRFSKR